MGFLNLFTHLLPFTAPLTGNVIDFSLRAWLPETALHKQPIQFYPTSERTGYFGISISPPDTPPPTNLAQFTYDTSTGYTLSFAHPSSETPLSVIVLKSGEVKYSRSCKHSKQESYFRGNFSIDYFTYWPDRSDYDYLGFSPKGFEMGSFLACPGTLGGGKEVVKGYRLYAMTPSFHHGGCISLDFLVLEKKKKAEGEEIEQEDGREKIGL